MHKKTSKNTQQHLLHFGILFVSFGLVISISQMDFYIIAEKKKFESNHTHKILSYLMACSDKIVSYLNTLF